MCLHGACTPLAHCLHFYRNCRVCVTPTKEFGKTGRGLVYKAREELSTVSAGEYWRERRIEDVRGTRTMCAAEEKRMSQYYTAEMALTRGNMYSNKYGMHAIAPNEILHTVPHGIVALMKEILLLFTGACGVLAPCKHVQQFLDSGISPSVTHIFDARLAQMPMVRDAKQRCMHYRRFRNGIEKVGVFTADDHVALMQQMPFVVGTGTSLLRVAETKIRKAFIAACFQCTTLYLTLKKREVNEQVLSEMHTASKKLGENLNLVVSSLPEHAAKKINLNRPKVHAMLHFR